MVPLRCRGTECGAHGRPRVSSAHPPRPVYPSSSAQASCSHELELNRKQLHVGSKHTQVNTDTHTFLSLRMKAGAAERSGIHHPPIPPAAIPGPLHQCPLSVRPGRAVRTSAILCTSRSHTSQDICPRVAAVGVRLPQDSCCRSPPGSCVLPGRLWGPAEASSCRVD